MNGGRPFSSIELIKMYFFFLNKFPFTVEDNELMEIYRKAENNCNLFADFMRSFLLHSVNIVIIGGAVAYSCLCIWQGNYDTSTWFTPYNLYFPFNTSKVIVWYAYLGTAQAVPVYMYVFVSSTTISYFVSGCIYLVAFCAHIKFMIQQTNKCIVDARIKRGSDQKNATKCSSIEGRIMMKRTILFQSQIMNIFDMVSRINSALLFSQLLTNVLFFASAIFQLEGSIKHFNFNRLAMNSICISVGVFWSLFLCYAATITSQSIF